MVHWETREHMDAIDAAKNALMCIVPQKSVFIATFKIVSLTC